MKRFFVVVHGDTNMCIGWSENDFKTAYEVMLTEVQDDSDNIYMDMYEVPTDNIKGNVSEDGEFVLQYRGATIYSDDYEPFGIKFYTILEGTCPDDVKALRYIAALCNLSFKK